MARNDTANAPMSMRKKIGSTIYQVNAYFNPESKETIEEKILRIIKNDLTALQNRAIIGKSQTVRLPERSSV